MVGELPGITLPTARPLVPLEACMFLLDDSEDAVVLAVETCQLSLAFDIATPGAQRREIRVWRESLRAALERDLQPKAEDEPTVRRIVTGFFPEPVLTQKFVSDALTCSMTHVSGLIRARALHLAGERPSHSHALAATRITRESVVAWLVRQWIKG